MHKAYGIEKGTPSLTKFLSKNECNTSILETSMSNKDKGSPTEGFLIRNSTLLEILVISFILTFSFQNFLILIPPTSSPLKSGFLTFLRVDMDSSWNSTLQLVLTIIYSPGPL